MRMGCWGASFLLIGMMWAAALAEPATNPSTRPATAPATQNATTQSATTEATQPQTENVPTTTAATTATAPTTEAVTQPQTRASSVPTTVSATQPASRPGIPVDASTPRGAIKVLDQAIALGDVEALIGIVRTQSDMEVQVVRAYAENRAALVAFRNAMWSKFPPSASERDGVIQRLSEVMQQVDQWHETIDGDSASVSRDLQPTSDRIGLTRVDGKWKVNFSSVFKPEPGDLSERSRALDIETRVFRQLAEETSAGKYQSVDELQKASTALMQSILSSATTQPSTTQSSTTQPMMTQPSIIQVPPIPRAATQGSTTQPTNASASQPAATTGPSTQTQPDVATRPATTENSPGTWPSGVSTSPAQ